MRDVSRTGASSRHSAEPALPGARLKYGQSWLHIDRYPTPEEAQRLACLAIPEDMELGDWSLSPKASHWSLFVGWHAPDTSVS
jgi:hypothetical protein